MDAGTKAYLDKEESVRRVEDYFREIGCYSTYGKDPVGDLIESHRRLRDINQGRYEVVRKFHSKFRFLPFRLRQWLFGIVHF